MTKNFKLTKENIKQLLPENCGGCLATDHITVDGHKVGYMYREKTSREADTGWRFFSGLESQAYIDNLNNTSVYNLNTIANYDPDIIPLIHSEPGTAYARNPETGVLEKED